MSYNCGWQHRWRLISEEREGKTEIKNYKCIDCGMPYKQIIYKNALHTRER